jgi:hypothetical protein
LYALDNYQRAWDPLKDHWKWREAMGTIRNEIFLQKQQLDTTLGNLDLRDPTMGEVEAALQIRFPGTCNEFMKIISNMDRLINQVAKDLYPEAEVPVSLLGAEISLFGPTSTDAALSLNGQMLAQGG